MTPLVNPTVPSTSQTKYRLIFANFGDFKALFSPFLANLVAKFSTCR